MVKPHWSWSYLLQGDLVTYPWSKEMKDILLTNVLCVI